jgi:hypothetical protein
LKINRVIKDKYKTKMVTISHGNNSRVVMGGAFNLPRVNYSQETQELLKGNIILIKVPLFSV